MGKPIDPTCRAFQAAIDVLARPWTGLLLGLLHDGPLRFSELEERAHGVGAKTLSARLKDLETRRIVTRHVDPGPPVRVQYTLSARGRAFGEVAEAIQRWGAELVASEPMAGEPVAAAPTPGSVAAARARGRSGRARRVSSR
jgi:DNA-binding HxlR family transcriptional regulator